MGLGGSRAVFAFVGLLEDRRGLGLGIGAAGRTLLGKELGGALVDPVIAHGDRIPRPVASTRTGTGKCYAAPGEPEAAQVSVCRSPLGEWHIAAPAERNSAKAKGEARGH
jgi:hypothetical protein